MVLLRFRVIHPTKMACGFMVTAVLFLLFFYVTNEKAAASHFKKRHPIISILIVFIGAYFITYMIGSLLVFFFGILLPFSSKYAYFYLYNRYVDFDNYFPYIINYYLSGMFHF